MYVTRPLSLYHNFPNAATDQPPEGPSSGILVIEDGEAEEQSRCCWGLCKNSRVYNLPYPQNRMIQTRYTTGVGQSQHTHYEDVYFIPVLNQPLSSNFYYVIRAHGTHKGETCKCSTEEDVSTFCLCTCVKDVEPSPFDHRDVYQQIEIVPHRGRFRAKSVASDGIPPEFLRSKGWRAYTSKQSHCVLGEALGIDAALRILMPNLDFPASMTKSPSVVVGKWYCPYIFIKEVGRVRDQMKRSMFYEMTLEQFWEEIYRCEDSYGERKVVEVGASVRRELPLLNGNEVVNENTQIVDGVVWFKAVNSVGNGLGLSLPIWERMRWEQARGGWVGGETVERVKNVEAFEGYGGWKKYACYVLVERFVLKRMNGSVALTYDFKHTNKIKSRWE